MVKLLLVSKIKETKDGRKFRKFFSPVKILVKGEEDKGLQDKTITVKFGEGINTSNFIRGILTVKEENIEIPYKWEVKPSKKNPEKLKYPEIWIKHSIESFEPRVTNNSVQFTGLEEETDTEETEISSVDTPF